VALTGRGKAAIGVVAAALVTLLAILAFTGNAPGPIQDVVNEVIDRPEPCPLTGKVKGDEDAPTHPAITVKVENTEDAYPLAGLERADVVYEEPVEGGITRFAAIFHCRQTPRVGPVRSARTTDPKIVLPYADHPLLAYSGANSQVADTIDAAGIISLTETSANAAYARDDTRIAPHNLFASTKELLRIGLQMGAEDAPPVAPFTFDSDVPEPSKPRTSASISFSTSNVAEWRWADGHWVRQLDGSDMTSEAGVSIAVANVVIQEVVMTESEIMDVTGAHSPELKLVGKGRAWILRDGRLIVGRWRRASLEDVTTFETRGGEEISMDPGHTFVELMPKGIGDATFAR
jgi:DUF3048 family protein